MSLIKKILLLVVFSFFYTDIRLTSDYPKKVVIQAI
jgi:hypothetical protein